MADEHFSWEIIERFFRTELSRDETRGFVRHLLRQCPRCSGLLQEVSKGRSFRLMIHRLESPSLSPDSYLTQKIVERIPYLAGRMEAWPLRGSSRRRA